MELIIFVVLLAVCGVLAMRYGSDSRERAGSEEETLATLGIARDNRDTTGLPRAKSPSAQRSRSSVHRSGLLRLGRKGT